MNKPMNKIEKLIAELCPEGVEFKELGEVCQFKRGSTITKKDVTEQSIPVIAGGQNPAYYHNITNRSGETTSVSSSGAYAGFVGFWTIPVFLSDSFSVNPVPELLKPRYVFHFLKHLQDEIYFFKRGGGVPHVHGSDLAKFRIPIPPLAVQQEIVKILDTFTTLEAELEARKKQYAYYREELLTFGEDVQWKTLGEVGKLLRGTAITAKETTIGEIPVVANAPNPIYFHSESNRSGETIVVARSGAYAGLVSFWSQPIFLTDAFSVSPDAAMLKAKFVYYLLKQKQETIHSMKKGSGAPHVRVKDFESYSIPIPLLAEQERIVAILDKLTRW